MNPAPPQRQPGCPSDLDLELWLSGAAAAKERLSPHLEGCAACKARLAWAEDAARAFAAGPLVRTREAVVDRTLGPRAAWGGFRFWVPALGLAAAALLAFVAVPQGPPEGYVGLKGSTPALGLEVWRGVEGHGERLAPGAKVSPGDGLRFSLVGPSRKIWLFTVDARGELSLLSPADGRQPREVSGVLPGGAVLDDVLGPERVFAVDAEAVGSLEALRALVKETYGADPAKIRGVDRLPIDGAQDSVLLEKVAP